MVDIENPGSAGAKAIAFLPENPIIEVYYINKGESP